LLSAADEGRQGVGINDIPRTAEDTAFVFGASVFVRRFDIRVLGVDRGRSKGRKKKEHEESGGTKHRFPHITCRAPTRKFNLRKLRSSQGAGRSI
jgi:hypothetical protein